MTRKIKVSAPGKLMLAGEWAVLEVGSPAIVASVDKRVYTEIEESNKTSINLPEFGIDLEAEFDGSLLSFSRELSEKEKKDLKFLKQAIEITLKYLESSKKFKIKSWGEDTQIEIGGEKKKIGFGSSAASSVASVSAILSLHGFDIKKRDVKDKVYKLAACAHYFAQGEVGSGFDVAASTYGGVVVYERFDPEWLVNKIKSRERLNNIIDSKWNGFRVEGLKIPESLELLIGWTKESASTSDMVKQVNKWAKANELVCKKLYGDISGVVRKLIMALNGLDKSSILSSIKENEILLRELGQLSGVNIETAGLKLLSDLANGCGAAGKLSGAGGGDCGIAICFDKNTRKKVKDSWRSNGFYLVDTSISKDGVRIEQ